MKKLKAILLIVVILSMITVNLSVYISSAYTIDTSTNQLTIEKISNPDSGEGEADGLVDGGDRETSYSWAMAARDKYLYIGTNRNIIGSVADSYVSVMASAGVSEDIAWALIDSMTNNEIPRPTTQDGGEIFKCDMTTGEIEKIYTAESGVAFRMAIEFEGNLYFASYSSETGADNYIYKIDENDEIEIVFTSSNGTSLRASCVYDNTLLFGGVDERIELDEGYEDYQKLAILQKDSDSDTVWERIADYKDFGDYATDAAVFSTTASPIWDICTYNGYVYAVIPNTVGIVMFRGHPAEGDEKANEYGWYWEEVIGKNNGINNIGLADSADGYSSEDEAGYLSVAGTPIVYNGKLYLFDFDNTIMAELEALTGLISELAGQDVKPSDYLKTMYITLNHPQRLWCYDEETGKFNEVEGFTEYMENNCIEYIWRAAVYHDELYITTMDSAVIYNYITNLKASYFSDLTDEEIDDLIEKIDDLSSTIANYSNLIQNSEEIEALLENLPAMLEAFQAVGNDSEAFYKFVINYKDIIDQIAEFGTEYSNLLAMSEEFQELYNKVDWEGLKMYAYIAQTIDTDVWGFDLLKTADGENFEVVTDSGFNDKYNYGGRSIQATDYGLFIGTANPFYGTQLWRITDGTEDIDTEDPDTGNTDTEDPDTGNTDTEDPDTGNTDTEDPDSGNTDTENPDSGNTDTEDSDTGNTDTEGSDSGNTDTEDSDNTDTDDLDDEQIIDEWQEQLEDPEQLVEDLEELNDDLNINTSQTSVSGSQTDSTVAQTQLPYTGNAYIFYIGGIVAIGILLISGYKFFKYKNIDKC